MDETIKISNTVKCKECGGMYLNLEILRQHWENEHQSKLTQIREWIGSSTYKKDQVSQD
jgi:hypothetical protein